MSCLSIFQSFCLSVCLSVCLFVCLFVCLSVCPSVCLPVCLSVCLSFYITSHAFFLHRLLHTPPNHASLATTKLSRSAHNLYSHFNTIPPSTILSYICPRRSFFSNTFIFPILHTLTIWWHTLKSWPLPLSHPFSHILIFNLNTCSMLNSQHLTALNDLTEIYNPDTLALTETWIRLTSTPAELIVATPPGYSLFSTSAPLLLIPPNLSPQMAPNFYSKNLYSIITPHILILPLHITVFNIYRPPPPLPYSQPFSTFFNQFSSFLSKCRYHFTRILHHRELQHTCW